MCIHVTVSGTLCILPLIIPCKIIVGIVGTDVGTARRHVFIFFPEIEPVVNRNIVAIAFAVLLQTKTVCINADQFGEMYTSDVHRNALIWLDGPLISKNNIPVE